MRPCDAPAYEYTAIIDNEAFSFLHPTFCEKQIEKRLSGSGEACEEALTPVLLPTQQMVESNANPDNP